MKPALLLGLLLAAAPLVAAHNPPAPRLYCEDPSEWRLHEYGGPSPGNAVVARTDGNLNDCNGDGTGLDYDGHAEYAIGGAFLSVESGDGVSSGSVACYNEEGHHFGGAAAVHDEVVGGNIFFVVTADYSRVGGQTTPDCGDNLVEVCNHDPRLPTDDPFPLDVVYDLFVALSESPGFTCNPADQAVVGVQAPGAYASVNVPFPPGIDGSYGVFVGQGAIHGHVWLEEFSDRPPGDLPFVCPGHGTYPVAGA